MKKSWRVENKYSHWYDALMEKARRRKNIKKPYENHHTIPQALGGRKSEVVRLTFREHFLAHWLLIKFVATKSARWRMAFAFRGMSVRGTLTSWQYDVSRRAMLHGWENLPRKEKKRRIRVASEANRKQRLDPEFVKTQAEAASRTMKSNWEDAEFAEKVIQATIKATKERWEGPRFRAKQSRRLAQVAKDSWNDPDIREKTIKSMQETWNTPENKEVQRQKVKEQWENPEFRERMKETTPVRIAGAIKSNQERVWTPEMTAKRVASFIAFYDAKRGGPKPPKPGKAKGERSGMAKLTEKDVREIRRLEGKMKRPAVAVKFGITYYHVRDIQKWKVWKHVA